MPKVLLAFGTRPETIKLAPVYGELRARADGIRVLCCVTGQHRDILDPFLRFFDIRPDYDLNILKENQTLSYVAARVLQGMTDILLREQPHLLIVQGDTTSAFAAALAAFHLKIPIAHVEAGLRSYDRFQPFPEEVNRTFISHMADLNFCPTDRAAENLRRERIDESSIRVTGNTVIDALFGTLRRLEETPAACNEPAAHGLPQGRMILVTGHRRENFDGGLADLSRSLVDLTDRFPDVTVVYSLHPNPHVRRQVEEILRNRDRIRIIAPPDYFGFVALMRDAYFIITDSGGIQEEAPSLRKPVLVARNVTERPEAVEAGAAVLVGTDRGKIFKEAAKLLDDPDHYASMQVDESPFGDGRAAVRIVDEIEAFLGRAAAGSLRNQES
ncbi:MAG: UDP-N-acetylglucosamine 2-epimerase (non-hydrolyzing) [Desulfomonilaceae bacterium]|nr:UDP-N-acetylglucosamine 2-epimerase (non-hydrolyzing) [Desulfomonilaceae bacterium]